ncbi:hypothetical protein [Wukongibacter sp. M2B1]
MDRDKIKKDTESQSNKDAKKEICTNLPKTFSRIVDDEIIITKKRE